MHRIGTVRTCLFAIAAGLSCSHSGTATPTPAPAPAAGAGRGTAAAPPAATPPPAAGTGVAAGAPGRQGGPPGGGPPGGGPGGGRGPQLTPEQRAARRDSLTTMRAGVAADVMKGIAGYETARAGTVFKGLQLFQDSTATAVVTTMDKNFGMALSVGCTFCHVAGNWADDSKQAKQTTRVMIAMVNEINSVQLAKLGGPGGGRTPKINCVTCHRGNQQPGRALIP